MAELPLTLRLNNPGAIEFGPFARRHGGQGGQRFAAFPDLASGFQAMDALLGSYRQRGLTTPAQVIGRWAPANVDNNSTSEYATFVAKRLGIGPNDPIPDSAWPQLAEAMATFEAGRPVSRPGTAPTVRTVQTIPVGPQTAAAAPTAPATAAAPTTPQPQPAGLLAVPGGSQNMANGTQPEQDGVGGFVQGLLADPTFNLGIGLLAAGGPSTTPTSLGQALAQGVQFSSQRQQEATKNDIARQQLLARQQQQQARARLGEALPSLLGNMPPEQQRAMSLLIEAAPEQAIPGLLAQLTGPQRAPTSLVRNLQAAGIDPASEEGRKIILQNLQGGGLNPLQAVQMQNALLEFQKRQREEAGARRTEAQTRVGARDAFTTGLNTVREMSGQLDALEGSILEPGRVLPEQRRALLSLTDEALSALGVDDGGERRRIIANRDKFVKNASDFIIKMFSRMPGQMTDSRQTLLEQSLAGISTSPGAARSILARTMEEFIRESQRNGVEIPAAEMERAQSLIARLRGGGEAPAAPGTAAPEQGGTGTPAPTAAPATPQAQPAQPSAAPGAPRRFSTEAAARRAFERGLIKAGDEVIVNGRRFIVRDQ